jgi:hypothetical protein
MEKEKQKYFFDCGRQYQLTGEGTFNQVYNETYGSNNHLCCTPRDQIKRYVNCIGCDRKPLTDGGNK